MSCFLGAGSCSVDKEDDTSDSDVENIGSGMWKFFFLKTFEVLSFSFIKFNAFQEAVSYIKVNKTARIKTRP